MSYLAKVIGVRVTEDLYSKIKAVSQARGEDVSVFIRRAILKELASLSFLSDDQKRALGIREVKGSE